MLKLVQAPNIAIATLWVDVLRQAGFDASMQRYYLGSGAGDLPPDQCLPEVWLMDAAQEAEARSLLHAFRHLPQRRWVCVCGELVEGGFEQCWNCGVARPV